METSSPIFPPKRIYQCTITNLVQLRRQLYPAREKNGNKRRRVEECIDPL